MCCTVILSHVFFLCVSACCHIDPIVAENWMTPNPKDTVMILYGVPLSPFVRKVMFMLDELDIAFEQNNVPPASDDPEFRAVSPLGRIPGLADGNLKLSDSSAICHYLAMRHDSALMGGDDPVRFARIIGFDKYADEDLAPPGLQLLVERVVKPLRFKQASDESLVEEIVGEKLPPVFDVLDRHLAENERTWFVDETFCYADMAMAPI